MRKKLDSFSSSSSTLVSREAQCSQLQSTQMESIILHSWDAHKINNCTSGNACPLIEVSYTDRACVALYYELDSDPSSFDETRLYLLPPAQRMLWRIFPVVPVGPQMNSCCGNTPPFLVKWLTPVFFIYQNNKVFKKRRDYTWKYIYTLRKKLESIWNLRIFNLNLELTYNSLLWIFFPLNCM